MPKLDTHDIDAVAGAIYFVVGRATEGGPSSYHLTIAGVTAGTKDLHWGEVDKVQADSGYSLGTIQVDLGKRGTWPLGSAKEGKPIPGERTYVDAIVDESAKFAKENGRKYTEDKARLRADLLTHGNGKDVPGTLRFIDPDTRDSINAWASSASGQPWIHRNIDYPQIRHATQVAMDALDQYGKNIPEDRRFETIALIVKTENQLPAKINTFKRVLKDGGDYDDLVAAARQVKAGYRSYDGLKAVDVAGKYMIARNEPETAAALDRAQAKVASADFNPSLADADVDVALGVIGRGRPTHVLRQGSRGDQVASLQIGLARLGFTDAHGLPLKADGAFGPGTLAAVESFQRAHGLKPDGLAGPETLKLLHDASSRQAASLAETGHPGHAMFCQALEGVHAIDARYGRTPDTFSANLAGSLATAARARGLERIDQVILGEGATRAFALQGDPRSPLRQIACVEVAQAVATPLAQSSAAFLVVSPPVVAQQAEGIQAQSLLAQPSIEGMHR